MLTPENTKQDLERLAAAMGKNQHAYTEKDYLMVNPASQEMTIRGDMTSLPEKVSLEDTEKRICRVPTISCPPAIPIAVPGEVITKELVHTFRYYGITQQDVVKG